MDNTELQKLLDALDRRLALGEIDIGTYNQLKAKFSAQVSHKEEPVSAAVSALGRDAVALQCPGCMAPLPLPADPSQVNTICEYCGGTFALQAAADETERLRDDIRKWISQVAGSAGMGATVDEASRRFIFRDKLLPQLKSAGERVTDVFTMTRYQPLFTFSPIGKLASSPFHQALQSTPDLSFLVDRLKETAARVQSPEIKVFAIGEMENHELHLLEVRCLEVCYLANVRHHLAASTPDGFDKAKTNLRALAELYGRTSQLSASVDPSLARFSSALAIRMAATEEAVKTLEHLLSSPEDVMTDAEVGNLELAATKLEQAAVELESAGREPKETIPASEGTRIDAYSVRILATCVRLFGQCGAETGESFVGFINTVDQLVEEAKGPLSDLRWLSALLSNLALYVDSMAGEASLPIVSDFGWVEGRMKALIRSSLFGGTESAESERRILLPFWVAELDFSQQKGVIFKKGQAVEGLVLLEAARHNRECYVVIASDPLSSQCYEATKSPTLIGHSTPAIVPVMGPDAAFKQMKQFVSSAKGYAGGYVRPLGLVLLPVAVTRYYTKKAERREVLTPCNSISVSTFEVGLFRLGTRDLLLIR